MAEYPALFGVEAKVRGLSAEEMARLIVIKAMEWQVASDKIEAAALGAKISLQDATNVDDIVAILAELAVVHEERP